MHPCPLCGAPLFKYISVDVLEAYECEAKQCLNDDMPRYKLHFENGNLVSRIIQFPINDSNLHVFLDYKHNTTTITSMIGFLLIEDPVKLPRVLDFDLEKPYDLLLKIKKLLVFS